VLRSTVPAVTLEKSVRAVVREIDPEHAGVAEGVADHRLAVVFKEVQ
jgi:hypothetical protein